MADMIGGDRYGLGWQCDWGTTMTGGNIMTGSITMTARYFFRN